MAFARPVLAWAIVPGEPSRVPPIGTPLRLEKLDPRDGSLWWLPAAAGETSNRNRGHVAHVLIGVQAARIWALGSGPSAAFGARLNELVRQQFGRDISDCISPWPYPELVLGQRGIPSARSWAHEDVIRAMHGRCHSCVASLSRRLADAASDLGSEPIRIPQHRLQGSSGRLGPWRWWRFARDRATAVTAWAWRDSGIVYAPGLLWGEGAPDGSDSSPQQMHRATQLLASAVGTSGRAVVRWLGQQGPLRDQRMLNEHLRYWPALARMAAESVARGDDGTARAPPIPGLPGMSGGLLHELNWQRAWRQAEGISFQRSRR